MDENKLAKSVQHVMVVFLFLFIALITYIAYFQGGLTWNHAKLGILMSLEKLVNKGIVVL